MLKVLQKLQACQKDIEVMQKDGYNDFNKYKFLSETQITMKIKTLFDKYNLLFHYQSEITGTEVYQGAKGDTQFLVTVKVTYSILDSDSGEGISGVVVGQGADKGDKGVYKAITGAIKYLYMKMFNIPTGDDAEKESPELKPAKKTAADAKYDPRPVTPKQNKTTQTTSDLPF